jgi:hypothetical protein
MLILPMMMMMMMMRDFRGNLSAVLPEDIVVIIIIIFFFFFANLYHIPYLGYTLYAKGTCRFGIHTHTVRVRERGPGKSVRPRHIGSGFVSHTRRTLFLSETDPLI